MMRVVAHIIIMAWHQRAEWGMGNKYHSKNERLRASVLNFFFNSFSWSFLIRMSQESSLHFEVELPTKSTEIFFCCYYFGFWKPLSLDGRGTFL
jgi:hypothetical protein